MSLWGELGGIRKRRGRKGSTLERGAGQALRFCRRAQGRGKRTPGGLRENKNGQCDSDAMESLPEVVIALSSWLDDKPIRHPASVGPAPQPLAGSVRENAGCFLLQPLVIAKRDKDEEIDNVFP